MRTVPLILVVTVYWVVGAACSHLPTCAGQDAPSASRNWQLKPNESVARVGPQGIIWQFNYNNKNAKPCFHPVAMPSGEVLTWDQPVDHAWHHALWFSWKTINGINYWEEDPQTGQSAGKTSWSNVIIQTHDDGRACITMDLSYNAPGEQPILTEKRTVLISSLDENAQQYHFDWSSKFTAGAAEVVLDRTPVPPDPAGKLWGGYAGLSIRFAEDLTDRLAFSANGSAEFSKQSIHRSKSMAMDYNGLIGGRPVGIAMLDHPDNRRYPTPWYAIRSEMSYLNAAFLTYQPYTLPAGESFSLCYRLVVHQNRWDDTMLQAAYERYLSELR
jgi:hypothetical protein